MKKNILWILIFFLFPILVNAEEKTEFQLEKGIIKDDEIELNLVIKNNPKFCYFSIEILFDKDNLEYISSNIIGLEKAMLKGIEKNLDGNIVVYAVTLPEKELINDTGTIATIKWKRKEKKEQKFEIVVKEYAASEDEELPYEVKNLIVEEEITNSSNVVFVKDKISLINEIPNGVKKEEIKWKSSDEEIAIVDQDGIVTFLKDGEVTIEGKIKDDIIYKKEYHIDKNAKRERKHQLQIFSIILVSILFLFIIILQIVHKKKAES